jgi:hypothetical protein
MLSSFDRAVVMIDMVRNVETLDQQNDEQLLQTDAAPWGYFSFPSFFFLCSFLLNSFVYFLSILFFAILCIIYFTVDFISLPIALYLSSFSSLLHTSSHSVFTL